MRHQFHGRGAGACTNHRFEIRTALVLRAVRVVDAVVDLAVDWLEGHFLGDVSGSDPARFLPHGGLVPTGLLTVVSADIQSVTNHDGPNPRWSAIRSSVLAKGRDV